MIRIAYRSLSAIFALGLLAMLGMSGGCSGSHAQKPQSAEQTVAATEAVQVGDDAARCDYVGRPDREAHESAGIGSVKLNILRVYALVGEGEDRRRVLLCRAVDTNLDGIKDVVRTFNDKGESLREVADSDYDNKIDTWITFAGGRIAKVQVDTNHDGKPDETRYYVRGKLSRIQRDTNHDGRPDVWEIYEDGHLRRIGHDLDFDGHVDRWDRDEVAERAALERELAEEKKQSNQGESPPQSASPSDGGVTDAYVSPRNR